MLSILGNTLQQSFIISCTFLVSKLLILIFKISFLLVTFLNRAYQWFSGNISVVSCGIVIDLTTILLSTERLVIRFLDRRQHHQFHLYRYLGYSHGLEFRAKEFEVLDVTTRASIYYSLALLCCHRGRYYPTIFLGYVSQYFDESFYSTERIYVGSIGNLQTYNVERSSSW